MQGRGAEVHVGVGRIGAGCRVLVALGLGVVLMAATTSNAGAARAFEAAGAAPQIQGGLEHYSPFLARVTGGVGGNEEYVCSGTVIAPEWVLTAGHCVGSETEPGPTTFPASYFKVFTGNVAWKLATVSTVAEAKRPAGWSEGPDFVMDDVGLLRLSSPVAVEAIKLASPAAFAAAVTEGAEVSATGFGLTDPYGEEPSPVMRLVTGLEVLEVSAEGSEGNDVIIGSESQKGTCKGDSGGPFIDSEGQEVAVTSSGPSTSCNLTAAQRIDVVDQWISENVEPGSPHWYTDGSRVAKGSPDLVKAKGALTVRLAGSAITCKAKGLETIENPANGFEGAGSVKELELTGCKATIPVCAKGEKTGILAGGLPWSTELAGAPIREMLTGAQLAVTCTPKGASPRTVKSLTGTLQPTLASSDLEFGAGSGELEESGEKATLSGNLALKGPRKATIVTAETP